jgi:hypothetical protein
MAVFFQNGIYTNVRAGGAAEVCPLKTAFGTAAVGTTTAVAASTTEKIKVVGYTCFAGTVVLNSYFLIKSTTNGAIAAGMTVNSAGLSQPNNIGVMVPSGYGETAVNEPLLIDSILSTTVYLIYYITYVP